MTKGKFAKKIKPKTIKTLKSSIISKNFKMTFKSSNISTKQIIKSQLKNA